MRKFLGAVLAVLFIAGSVFAYGELTSFYKTKFLGLNDRINPRLLSDDDSTDLSNVTLDETGAFRDRDAFGYYNSSAGDLGNNFITGLFKYYKSTGKYFVACAGSKICSGSGGSWTDITQAGLTPTSGSYWSAVTFNDELYLFNETCDMQNWDGTGNTTTPASTPTTWCAYAAVHKNRIWAAKSTTIPYRMYFSSLNLPEDWVTTGGYIDLPDKTQTISGLISWGGYLYIFTETNVYILMGSTPNDFSLKKSNSQVGAIAPRSIQVTDIGICFLARTGVFAFDGNTSTKLSDKVENTINGISKTKIQYACGLYDGQGRYWIAYTDRTGTYNNKILIYDIGLREWYKYDNLNISYFERAYGGTDRGELYGGSSLNNGLIYILQSSTGTESITNSSQSDFDNGTTFNTVTTSFPSVDIVNGIDDNTILLAYMDGADGAIAYTSDDYWGRVFSFFGNAQLDTAEYKYGISSVLFDGLNDYITLPASTDWQFGSNDFTIDFWVRLSDVSGRQTFVYGEDTFTVNDFTLRKYSSAEGHKLGIKAYNAGVESDCTMSSSWSMSADTWYHIAFVQASGVSAFYINGTKQATTGNIGTMPAISGRMCFGERVGDSSEFVTGWIDEVRISKSARWNSSFAPYPMKYQERSTNGIYVSDTFQINASGSSSLGNISWTGNSQSVSRVTFQTRTGETSDTVYFNGWEYWSSSSSVTFNTVTGSSVAMVSSDGTNFKVHAPASPQIRNITLYEDEDNVSPNCVGFTCSGAGSKNDYATETIGTRDISSSDWLSGWIKTPHAGKSVRLSFGEYDGEENAVTLNTVNINTWEKWYWYIGEIDTSLRDDVKVFRVKYLGDTAGEVYVSDINAQNYYDNEDTITSTPNDFIQYRSILFSNEIDVNPSIFSVTLQYTTPMGLSESDLSTYYQTKPIDFGSAQLNKQFLELFVELYNSEDSITANTVVYVDYNIDDSKSGTLAFNTTTTGNTVRIRRYFPSNAFGKTMKLKYRHEDKDAKITVRAMEVRYRPEVFND